MSLLSLDFGLFRLKTTTAVSVEVDHHVDPSVEVDRHVDPIVKVARHVDPGVKVSISRNYTATHQKHPVLRGSSR